MKKAAKIIGTIVSWVLLIVMIISIGILVITKISGGEPQFFGYRIFVVVTPSMTPTLNVGDVILSKTFEVGDDLQVNDILTYKGFGETENMLVTHRLVDISGDVGNRTLIMQGDANNTPDEPFNENCVVAIEICKLELFGKVYKVMQSKIGIPLLFIIIIAFIIFESVDFSKEVKKEKESKEKNK